MGTEMNPIHTNTAGPGDDLLAVVREAFEGADDQQQFLRGLRNFLHEISPQKDQPVDAIRWVPIEKVFANDYNPNAVAKNEMKLLHTSISHDGYTQPVVTVYDPENDRYVIVDGFHRYTTMRLHEDIREKCNGLLPIVVIEKDINDRMASTVRHNRARGKHSVTGMASMVFSMLENGWDDAAICAELGLEADELLRLKHVTGFSKLFEDVDYRQSWETRKQIRMRIEHERVSHAHRKTSAAGKKTNGGDGEDVDHVYEGRKVSHPTNEQISARQLELQSRYRNIVERAGENMLGVTCPSCGEDFFIEKRKATEE
jgi:hypothetical protein